MPIIPAVIGIGGAIGGALIGKSGATKAANTQAAAADRSAELAKQTADEQLAFQKQQYEEGVARQAPWLQSGQNALKELDALPAFQAPGADFTQDPGYQFRVSEGQKAVQNSAAAKGSALGGAALKAAQRFGQDTASNEYSNVYARRLGEYQNNLNRLQVQAGVGQSTATGLNALGANTANSESSILGSLNTNQTNAMNNAAAARASGYVTGANTIGGLVKSGAGALQDILKGWPKKPAATQDDSYPMGGYEETN